MAEAPQAQFRGSDRFELLTLLGRGATGVVYEAFDREHRLRVALKVLSQRSPEAIALFKNEFRALQGIRHRNLVELRELLWAEGHWLLSMELVAGIDIVGYSRGTEPATGAESAVFQIASSADQTVRHGRPAAAVSPSDGQRGGAASEARVRAAFAQLAEGLCALHAANMIHRDLKPSNVLVDGPGRVVVLDFGLVTDLGVAGAVNHHYLLGTPRYMAPEQAALENVDRASDWYSVGVMLHEALTGRTPCAGIPPLSAIEELFPDVSSELRALCLDLLALSPAARPRGEDVLQRLSPKAMPRTASPRPFAAASDSIFLGRQGELGELHRALGRVREGEHVAVVVEAESGIGKTSLVERFVEQVRSDAQTTWCLSGRCFERESLPYKAFDGVMDAVCRHLSTLSDGELADLVPDNVAIIAQAFPGLHRIARRLVPSERMLRAGEPLLQRQRLFLAMRELFVRLAEAQPLIVVIDDMQWADVDSLVLLSALRRAPAAPKMLLIAITRPGGPLADGALDAVVRLPLGPLSPAESAALVNRLVSSAHGDLARDQQVREVTEEAQGHPLFLREMARQLVGPSARHTATIRLDDALWSRVAALEPATRELVELTSIAGGPIAQGTVLTALALWAGQGEASVTSDRIAELRHAGLVRTMGSHPNDTIEPYHDRVREAVLAHIEPSKRRQQHLWLARALEQGETHDAEALANHFQEAGEPKQAYSYARQAAEQAVAALAFERAARLYQQALDLSPADATVRRQLARLLGDALANAGRGLAAAESYATAALGDETLEGLELRRLAAEQLLRSGYVERGIESVSAVLLELGIPTRKNRLLALLSIGLLRSQIRWRGFGYRQRQESEVSALTRARIDGTWGAAICLTMFDQLRSAELQCQNTLLSLRSGTPLQVLRAHTAEAMFLGIQGSTNRAQIERLLSAASELAEQIGQPEAHAWVALCRGVTAFFRGDWLAGEEQSSHAEAVFVQRAGAMFELASARVFRVWSSVMRGEFRQVLRLVPEYVDEAESRGDLYSATYHMTGIGNLAWLNQDDVAGARRRLALVERRWPSEEFHVPLFLNLQAAAHIELYEGRGQVAHQRVVRDWSSLRWGIGFRLQMTRFGARFARGLAALAAYDEKRDTGLLRDAAGCADAMAREGRPWGTCFGELLRSGVAARRGREERALTHLSLAEELASQSGLHLTRVAARYRRGELIAGQAGRLLIEESLALMAEQNIQCPERMLSIFAPPLRAR